MTPKLLTAALALPLVGLAGNVALNEAQLTRATVWEIPVTGYDPRDILRGNYIQFQYDVIVSGDVSPCADGDCTLCLTGNPPDGAVVKVQEDGPACRHPIDTGASTLNVRVDSGLVRETGTPPRKGTLNVTGRYFVSEFTAPELEKALADGPMRMRARLTRGGRLMNEALIPAKEMTP
ncbi:MAG: GDYXXLXY domain-containing protein [Pacificimonas sp.]